MGCVKGSVTFLCCNVAVMAVIMLLLQLTLTTAKGGHHHQHGCNSFNLTYYLQQGFGENEWQMVPAVLPAAPGTTAGFGEQVVYEFVMTETAAANSSVKGYVRGTGISVNNTTPATTFFVSNVIHYDYEGVKGTLYQQGEAIFTNPSWEFAIVGGTGAFRFARGYNVGNPVSFTVTSPTTNHVVTHYQAHFCMCPY